MKIETVNIDSLTPHPRNYREHPEDQLHHLAQSIKEHGIYRNVVVARDGTILAGHGVVKTLRFMGLTEVPIIRLDLGPDDPKALKLLAADNELSHLAIVDDRALTELLKEIKDIDIDGLLGTGYDEMMLASLVMVTRPASEIASTDAAREWAGAGMPEHTPGKESIALTIKFENEDIRDQFIKEKEIGDIALKRQAVWSTWWPNKERDDLVSVRFE